VHISDHDILTPGDSPSVLVAMNPAALKANLHDLLPGGTLIVNSDSFEERNLTKAGYADNPLTDGSLKAYTVYEVPMTSLTVEAGQLSKLPVFLGSYPITPASDILHELSRHKNFGVRTLQAEDEIAGVTSAIGAAFAGHLGVTTTSGPGIDLKSEAIGLAVSLELPLLIIDIQRGGPSTGLPTKTEQADLLLALFGRHGEAPVPVVAAKTPSHCFDAVIEAVRIAVKYRTPVFLLSDGYVANGSEPWLLPDVDDLPDIAVPYAT